MIKKREKMNRVYSFRLDSIQTNKQKIHYKKSDKSITKKYNKKQVRTDDFFCLVDSLEFIFNLFSFF